MYMLISAWSFIRNSYEANECPSVEAKIRLKPMLFDSCPLTDGVTPVAMFHIERSQMNSFDRDKVALPVCFCIPRKSCMSGLFVLLTCAVLHISK